MNTSELAKFIGREAELVFSGGHGTSFAPLKFRVRITDCKHVYGCTRMLVTPVSGQGDCWVDSARLSNISELCRAIT